MSSFHHIAFIYPLSQESGKIYPQSYDSTGNESGYDLYVPEDITIPARAISFKINHNVAIVMSKYDSVNDYLNEAVTLPYYMEPRSSMGSRTPLRLANSHGIIDAGYRGPLIAVVDNISDEPFHIKAGTRLFQITRPNLEPFSIACMSCDDDAKDDFPSLRGTGGFGSTGGTG